MAQPRIVLHHLLIVACFSRHAEAMAWGRTRLEEAYGPIALSSEPYAFTQTAYYAKSMGQELRKCFHCFATLVDPAVLAGIKVHTNELEAELAMSGRFPEERPLNLDPGLLNLGKFMLATTKDQAHRLYLRDAIFAEVTLRFQDGAYHPWPWTYADYRQEEVLRFMGQARELYKQLLRGTSAPPLSDA